MRRTWQLGLTIILLFCLFVVFGCGAKKSRISLAGSTSVQPIAETLAEAYMKKQPQIVVNVQGGGSSAGIKAVKDGTVAIGMSSRLLKPEEQSGLTAVEIARDGIAIVTNPANQVTNLSLEQVRDIFSGKISNWSLVGGAKASIVVVNREEGSGTRSAFMDVVRPASLAKSLVQGSTGAVRQSVAGNPNAIGYISLAGMDRSVRAVAINSVACNVANIKSRKYLLNRPFLFVYRKPATPEVKALLTYVTTDGQQIIRENGLVAIK